MTNTPKQDSIKIAFRQMVKATEALIELRNLKKTQGLCNEQLHKKDIVIAYYERSWDKLNKADSVNTILLKNKDREIQIDSIQIIDLKYALKQQKKDKILSYVVVTPISFLLGTLTGILVKTFAIK